MSTGSAVSTIIEVCHSIIPRNGSGLVVGVCVSVCVCAQGCMRGSVCVCVSAQSRA